MECVVASQGKSLRQLSDIGYAVVVHIFITHFQIATSAKGRGVLRLLLMKQQINLVCLPALFIQLLIVANQSGHLPSLVCFSVEVMDMIASINCAFSGFLVALGR